MRQGSWWREFSGMAAVGMFIAGVTLVSVAEMRAQVRSATASAAANPLRRTTLHAHNCFPEGDKWTDRIERALGTNVRPVAIEQDVMWYVDPATHKGRTVLAHGGEPDGKEPTLDEYFFAHVKPIIEKAIADNRRESWPVVYLHFNFRNNDPEHLQDVWDLLGRYNAWLTTTEKGADERTLMPLSIGPLMVLTEGGQEEVFYNRVPVGGRLRVFGTVPTGRAPAPAAGSGEAQVAAPVDTPADVLMPAPATNYKRWVNFPWAVVERGGQPQAGDWTADDAARLKALVDRAHAMNLAIRFYTLNGHPAAESQGWSAGYNFGTLDAARIRWRAAIDAGVDLIATDQYELLGEEIKRTAK